MSATQAGAGIITQVAGGLKACFVNATAVYDRLKGNPEKKSDLEHDAHVLHLQQHPTAYSKLS